MSHLNLIEKAWWYFDTEYAAYEKCIARGTTLSKARYAAYRELKDCGYLDCFEQILEGFKWRRRLMKTWCSYPRRPY